MRQKKLRITQADFMLANRKASREEEIREHGRQCIFRSVTQRSKKVYDRKRLKGQASQKMVAFFTGNYIPVDPY